MSGAVEDGRLLPHGSTPAAAPVDSPDVETRERADLPWLTIVWDDPVNLMSYVTYVLQKLFGYDKARATELMLRVHTEGKAAVSSGSRDKCEHDVRRLHQFGLSATIQRSAD